jgi:hypothetical protein
MAKIELTNVYFAIGEINRAVFKKSFTTSLYGTVNLINQSKSSLRQRIKLLLKKVLPRFIWEKLKKVYYKMKGIEL